MTKEYAVISSHTINKLLDLRDKSGAYMILFEESLSASQETYLSFSNKKEIRGKETMYPVDKKELLEIINELKKALK